MSPVRGTLRGLHYRGGIGQFALMPDSRTPTGPTKFQGWCDAKMVGLK